MIDLIGILRGPIGPQDAGTPGDAPPERPARPGWHVNVTPDVMTARPGLEAFRVRPQPGTLMRVWAGDDPARPARTVPLRFESEAEARAALWPDEAGT